MIKEGVTFDGIQPETIMGILVTGQIMREHGYIDMVTSITDGEHMDGSLHYDGLAFDRRTWADSSGKQLSLSEKNALADLFIRALPHNWDVVVEATHIHCECDKG